MNILVVGSCLIDLFINLEHNDRVKLDGKSVTFTLGDKVPIDIKALSLGGNGGNVASALKKLDIPTSFYTYLGGDVLSSYIEHVMQKEEVELFIEKEDSTTGALSLIFGFENDRVIFSHHNTFNHSFDKSRIITRPDVIFLTSIGKDWHEAYENVLQYAKENDIPVALSPGSQQLSEINETLISAIHQSKMLFCNMEEARLINDKLTGENIEDNKELLLTLKNNGFDLLSVTDGENGAYGIDTNNDVYKIPSLVHDGKEKTGAGDAYAGAFLASYMKKLSIVECMKRGVLNSIGVMSNVGAHTGQLRNEEMEKRAEETELIAQLI